MSTTMDQDIKGWAAKCKSALVLDITQGKTTVAEASRAYDVSSSEIEGWVEDGRSGMENALRTKPHDVREQYEGKLCRWFDIPRRTVYYKPVKTAPKVNPTFAEPIKAMIEEHPSFGYRTVAHLLGSNKNTV